MARTKNSPTGTTVYVLELMGDLISTPGSVTLEVGGMSTDKSKIEQLKVQKDKELDEYFGDDEDTEDDEEDEFDDDMVTYCGYDMSERPEWVITEHTLL